MNIGVASKGKQFPLKAGFQMVALVRHPFYNLPIEIFLARIGAFDRGFIDALVGFEPAVFVVGERSVNFRFVRMGRDPLRTAHGGGANFGGGQAGVNAYFSFTHAGCLGS